MLPRYRHLPACALLLSFLALLFIAGCTPKQESPPPPEKKPATQEKLTVSAGGPLPAILAIAANQDFFSREGLDVSIKSFAVGKNAVEELLAGGSDFSVSAETPVVAKSLIRDDIVILSSLRTTNNLNRIAARRDRGIGTAADLKGRRVATTKGIAPHYFLDLLLAKNGMSEKDIEAVFVESDKLQTMLLDGSVDAIATINQIAYRSLQKLADKGILLKEPGLCLNYSILLTLKKNAATHPERIVKMLRALHAAEKFRQQFPDKSREIIMASQKLSREEYDAVWSSYDDRLALDGAMLLTLEENARWVLQKGLATERRIPNYLDFIDATYLRKVTPEAVRLKR